MAKSVPDSCVIGLVHSTNIHPIARATGVEYPGGQVGKPVSRLDRAVPRIGDALYTPVRVRLAFECAHGYAGDTL